jgi:hypothetical protein
MGAMFTQMEIITMMQSVLTLAVPAVAGPVPDAEPRMSAVDREWR